jgi:hypothetical protein
MDVLEGGQLRLTLDDLEAIKSDPQLWEKRCLFTHFDLDELGARTFQLGNDAYASVGEAVLARLFALNSVSESKDR